VPAIEPWESKERGMAISEDDPAYEDFVRAYEKLVGARKRLQETAGLKRTDRKRHAAYEYHRCAKAAYGKLHGANAWDLSIKR